MNIDWPLIISAGGMIASISFAWGKIAASEQRWKEESDNIWKEMTKYRNWRDEHERDSADYRLQVERSFGEIRAVNAERSGKLDEILRRLEIIEKILEKR